MGKEILYGAQGGLNLKNLPSLLGSKYCTKLENIFYDGEGILRKRKGMTKILEIAGSEKITMLKRFRYYIIFTYGTTLAAYNLNTKTHTIIKNDFTNSDPFTGLEYGDYFYLCNGGDKIGYLDLSLNFNFIASAPKAKVLMIYQNRLFAGNLDSDEHSIKWSAQSNDAGVCFTNWTSASDPLLFSDANEIVNRTAGAVRSMTVVGNQIIVFYENGKMGFTVNSEDKMILNAENQNESISAQRVDLVFQEDYAGTNTNVFKIDDQIFYVNDAGIFSQQEDISTCLSASLGREYIANLDFSNSDITFLSLNNRLLISCADHSTVNNLVLAYDIGLQSWSEIRGWSIEKFVQYEGILYASDSIDTKLYQLFDGDDDDGNDIWCSYESSEMDFGDPVATKKSKNFYIKGNLSTDSQITVSFDIWDKKNSFHKSKSSFTWSADNAVAGELLGWGEIDPGEFDSNISNEVIESFGHHKLRLKNYLKIKIKLNERSQLPFELNFMGLDYESKLQAKKNNLTS